MANSSPTPSPADLIDGTLGLAAGLGIITMALFPLAIPLLALTAIALIPLLLIPVVAVLIAAPFLLLRRLFRRAAAPEPGRRSTPRRKPARQAGLAGCGGEY